MKKLLLFVCLLIALSSKEALRLPKIFSNNMVLQQNALIPVWGWAAPGTEINVSINNQQLSTKTGSNGKWMLYLNPIPAGGPYVMAVKGDGSVNFSNVLIGEVWFASGQSNMQFEMVSTKNSKEEIKDAQKYSNIRIFKVPNVISIKPEEDLPEGEWKICDSTSIKNFSAVAYFFGRNLHQHLKVPVGLIASAWGGTPAESWTSYEMLHSMNDFRETVDKMHASKLNFNELVPNNEINKKIVDSLTSHSDKGIKVGVNKPKYDDASWKTKAMPYDFGKEEPEIRGFIWMRKSFTIPKEYKGKKLELHIGKMVQTDDTYFNGENISSGNAAINVRNYPVSGKLVKEGTNVIAIKLLKGQKSSGGIIDGPCEIIDPSTKKTVVDLSGEWKYNEKVEMPFPKVYHLAFYPTVLFNSMVNPIIPYAIKGAIWYQGESNGTEGIQYRELLPKMISDWRVRWGQGYFPFCYVQITNFLKKDSIPAMDPWPEMREAQLFTLRYPNTAMASAIDLGEMWNIHPTNKQDVGYRLFLNARKVAYNESLVYMGPTYDGYKVEGNKIRIFFTNTGSGLTFKTNPPTGFAIAGDDQKFYWADAVIENNSVIVSSNKVNKPVAVRYGWSNNPDVSLYNKEELPASPFRTDDWPLLSQGKKKDVDLDFLK